jgi:FtsZ-binding cell division protein ZapB
MAKKQETEMSEDEQIGFHKGSLSTLAKERVELSRLLGIVEQLMQMHIAALKKLGVDLEQAAKEAQKAAEDAKKSNKPIEDMI